MERKTKVEAEEGKQKLVITREFELPVYRSVGVRDQLLQLPFAQGINMAHNRLQDIVSKLK